MLSATNSAVPLQTTGGDSLGLFAVLVLTLIVFVGFWKTFEKAGDPGWAGIVPIYNFYVLVRISGNAWWWFLLFFVPLVNFLATVKVSIDVAGKFNKGVLFGLGLTFLSFIFFPILGFGGSQYQDTTGRSNSTF